MSRAARKEASNVLQDLLVKLAKEARDSKEMDLKMLRSGQVQGLKLLLGFSKIKMAKGEALRYIKHLRNEMEQRRMSIEEVNEKVALSGYVKSLDMMLPYFKKIEIKEPRPAAEQLDLFDQIG